MKSKSASITVDAETFQMIEKLAKRSNRSIAKVLKDLVKKQETVSPYRITKEVKEISGILKTSDDYKKLRDLCIGDRMERYERID